MTRGRHRDGRDRAAVAADPGGTGRPAARRRSPRSCDELERLGVAQVTILVAGGLLRRTTPARDRPARPARVPSPLQGPRDRARRRGGRPRRARQAGNVTLRVNPALVETDLVVTVTAAETVLHGGPAALLAASGRESLRAAGALSLLETSASQGWRLAVEIERLLAAARAGDRRLARAEPAARRRPVRRLPARPGRRSSGCSARALRRALPVRAGPRAPAHPRAPAARADRGGGRTAARRRSRTPRRCCAERCSRAIELDEPVDALVIGIPPTTPFMPRERPNPVSAAYLGLGLALRLWRNAPPIAPGGTAILVHPFPRRFPRPTQAPYRALFFDPRTRARHRRDARRGAAAARTTSARSTTTAPGRACHPLQPFVEWSACDASAHRLGAVLIAGCRDAQAARQLGFVPVHGLGAALEMARGRGAKRIGYLLSPPYFPLVVSRPSRSPDAARRRIRSVRDMETVIETRALTKKFGDRAAVDGVDLVVPAGVAFGFLGPNGAGKTTMIRTLLGLTQATSGEVSLLGLPQPAKRREALARVGAIVEEPRFHPHLTGRENLKIVAAARDRAADGADRRVARARRARAARRRPRQDVLARHAPAARDRALPARRPSAADPRRADERPRPGRHPRDAPPDPRVRRRGPHRLPLVPPARRGREDLRPGRDRRPRPRRPAGRRARHRRDAATRRC